MTKGKHSGRSKLTVEEFYEIFDEAGRLRSGLGKLEFERAKAVVRRFLPPPPAVVLDVGGGPGPYSLWLARLGYEAHLIEPSARLHAAAKRNAARTGRKPLFHCLRGDARSLEFPAGRADAVLLFGPLYHLTEASDRQRALAEARRVLKKGGLLFCAGISRFASAIDGLSREFIKDPVFRRIIGRDLTDGRHRNPTDRPDYFTDAYFHEPSGLKREVEKAGFISCRVLAVEGLGILLRDIDGAWADPGLRKKVLSLIERTESEPAILGISPHLLAVARKRR
jgi:ubiquinone/menaquinone biosynthesis C-methylase UbiE